MLSKDEAVTSLPEEEPENYVTEMVAGDEAVTSLPEERPENYVTVLATQVGRAPVTPVIDEPIAPLPRPKPEPMDPEFVGLDSLAEAPFWMSVPSFTACLPITCHKHGKLKPLLTVLISAWIAGRKAGQ